MSHMGSSLIVEARGFDAAEIAAFEWNEYIFSHCNEKLKTHFMQKERHLE